MTIKQLKDLKACPEALEWVTKNSNKTPRKLWESCPNPEWLVWLLMVNSNKENWPDKNTILLLLCRLVEKHALPLMENTDPRSQNAIKVAKDFLRHKYCLDDVHTASIAAFYASKGTPNDIDSAVADAAYTVSYVIFSEQVNMRTGDFGVEKVVHAVSLATGRNHKKIRRIISNWIRNRVSVPL